MTEIDRTVTDRDSLVSSVTKDVNKRCHIENGNLNKVKKVNNLTCVYLNLGLGSMKFKMAELEFVLHQHDPVAIAIAETALTNDCEIFLNSRGYVIEKCDSERLWVAVLSNVSVKRRLDLEAKSQPNIWLEFGNTKKFVTAFVYREWQVRGILGSGSFRAQLTRWSSFLDKWEWLIDNEPGKEYHVIGDMNINCLKWTQLGGIGGGCQKMVDDLYDRIISKGAIQTVEEITRYGGGGIESILDLHFTNLVNKVSITLHSDTKSDHKTMVLKRKTKEYVGEIVIVKRNWKKVNWGIFKNQLWIMDLRPLLQIQDVDEVTERFTAALCVCADSQQGVKEIKIKRNKAEWVTGELLEMLEKKEKLYIKQRKTRKQDDVRAFKQLNNKISNMKQYLKVQFHKRKLDTKDSEELWKHGKDVLGYVQPGPPTTINVDGNLTSDPQMIADVMNKAFIEKIKKHRESIPVVNQDPLQYTREWTENCGLLDGNVQMMWRDEVHPSIVEKAIKSLSNSTAEGHTGLNTQCLKILRNKILKYVTHIVNLSLKQGVFPRLWKVAKIMPLHKSGCKFTTGNYRPVALLEPMSKILERIVEWRIRDWLTQGGLLADQQMGYRPNRSCQTALLTVQDRILKNSEEGHDTAAILCDLSAAFDTIPHSTLLNKMKLYGFNHQAIKWFQSYLSGRWQFVKIGSKSSKMLKILQGVMQGSILGPLLFILYINDIVMILLIIWLLILIYADDTSLLLQLTDDPVENQRRIDQVMELLTRYMASNGLKFNFKKTQLLICSTKKGANRQYHLEQDGNQVFPIDNARLLGLQLSQDMRHEHYLLNMQNNLLQSLHQRWLALYKVSKYCDKEQRRQFGYGLIVSKITFGACYWSTCTEAVKDKINVLLNKVVRTICDASRLTAMKPLFEELNWLTTKQLLYYHDLVQIRSIKLSGEPGYLSSPIQLPRIRRQVEEYEGAITRSVTRKEMIVRGSENQPKDGPRKNAFISRACDRYNEMMEEEKDIKDTNKGTKIFKERMKDKVTKVIP